MTTITQIEHPQNRPEKKPMPTLTSHLTKRQGNRADTCHPCGAARRGRCGNQGGGAKC
jgi:hypothetical protein